MTDKKNTPIKLCWWNGKPNFGDGLSQMAVEHASGRPVEWANKWDAEIFAIGSIMRVVRGVCNEPRDLRPVVWGTGIMGPQRMDFVDNIELCAVRGPATAALMGVDLETFGDPGLFASDLSTASVKTTDKIGIIPHIGDFKDKRIMASVEKTLEDSAYKIVDVRNEDPIAVVDDIKSCKYVYSASLHGLIVADSLGIPNTWVQGRAIHGSPRFKFVDYFSSVHRPFLGPIDYDDIAESHKVNVRKKKLGYEDRISELKDGLLNAFPSHMKA